jgi:tRNA pseudouridine38-40 synthase
VGRHDFAGFAANRGHPERNTVRTMRSASVRRRGSFWSIEFDGDGFLYRMVRLMVGAMVECAGGKLHPRDLVARLEKTTSQHMRRPSAPAAGLYLVRVRY